MYAEDLENALILLSQGERIYYDGRLVVSTEGPGTLRRWFSQRVGWYYGLIKVYTERFGEIWRISKRTPFAMYHFIVYLGGLSLVLHLVKIVSALLLLLSFDRAASTACSSRICCHATRSPIRRTSSPRSAAIWRSACSHCSPWCPRRSAPTSPPSCRCTFVRIHAHRADDGGLRQLDRRSQLWAAQVYQDHYEPGEPPAVRCPEEQTWRRLY